MFQDFMKCVFLLSKKPLRILPQSVHLTGRKESPGMIRVN